MTTCNYTSKQLFHEAICHCRWKKILYKTLQQINISDYKNKTFDEIITDINNICDNINGIGMLTQYDISSAICRYYKVTINKVYIIGNGPKRAIKLLNLKTKIHNINNKIKLHYVDINQLMEAFEINGLCLDENIRNIVDGDLLETYICNWQKRQ